MVCDFTDVSLKDLRKKLLEAKEILRYLNDEYFIDRMVDSRPYAEGVTLLREAADFVDNVILQSDS